MNRRGFLRGLLFAAPAIVAAPSLMRVSAAALPLNVRDFGAVPVPDLSFSDLVEATIRSNAPWVADNMTATNALYRHLKHMQADVYVGESPAPSWWVNPYG